MGEGGTDRVLGIMIPNYLTEKNIFFKAAGGSYPINS